MWHGVPIDFVDILHGAVLDWQGASAVEHDADGETLARLSILLTGVAARNRYSFGSPTTSRCCVVSWGLSPGELADLEEAWRLAELVDPDGELDVFFRSWCSALDFTAAEPTWRAMEAVAARLHLVAIDGREARATACGTGWLLEPQAPPPGED